MNKWHNHRYKKMNDILHFDYISFGNNIFSKTKLLSILVNLSYGKCNTCIISYFIPKKMEKNEPNSEV